MNNSAEPQSTQPAVKERLERSDVNFKAIVGFLIGLVVVAAILHAGLTSMFNRLRASAEKEDQRLMQQRVAASVAASRTFFPSPREQISPRLDLQSLRARENTELNSYRWVDQTNGVVQIPIERAMELVIQRGLPSFSTTNTPTSSLQLQQQRPIQSLPPKNREER
jgi:hypothetical protein